MGYFANLYTVQVEENKKGIQTELRVYGKGLQDGAAYVCWGDGVRQPNNKLHEYADGTVVCDAELKLLTGYPYLEQSEDPHQCILEATFNPMHKDDAVLMHFMLPKRFIPRKDLKPLVQPVSPYIFSHKERLCIVYPCKGPTTVQFAISKIKEHESLKDFQTERLLHPDEVRAAKVELEINFIIFKFKITL